MASQLEEVVLTADSLHSQKLRPEPRQRLFNFPPALRTSASPLTHRPAQATPSGPTSHSASAETPPIARTPTAPCTQEAAFRDDYAAETLAPLPLTTLLSPSRRVVTYATRRLSPSAPSRATTTASRTSGCSNRRALDLSEPRSGIPSPLPDGHDDPKTPGSRQADSARGPPSGTSAPRAPRYTGSPRIAPTSAPGDSDTHALLQPHRCESHPPLLRHRLSVTIQHVDPRIRDWTSNRHRPCVGISGKCAHVRRRLSSPRWAVHVEHARSSLEPL